MCTICELHNKYDQEPLHLFTEAEIEMIILAIYTETITSHNLDVTTYLKTARKLSEGVFDGYGKTLEDVLFSSEDYYMLKALRDNTYFFSAAKTYQQTRDISSLIVQEGQIVRFDTFAKQAREMFLQYNENYLRAEYNSAISQARTASQWQEITREVGHLPMLTYNTVGDGRVRPTHQALDNISRPVDDKFWNIYMPPNGWNCRCTVLQENEETEKTDLRGFKAPDDVPEIFKFNSGKDRIVFSLKHPYFKVAPQDKDFAKVNFNLPLP